MIKYAKIEDINTGLCSVGIGDDTEYYKSIGMELVDIEQSDIDFKWYISSKCPKKSKEQKEQEEKERIANLHMTPLDFINALATLRVTYEQIKALCDANAEVDKQLRFCNHVYRGNPLLDKLCSQFGVTPKQLDELFKKYGE